jgi:hypothetical protein
VPRLIRPLLIVCAVALMSPAAATAQAPAPVEIDGNPLNIWTDENGSVQVNVDGYQSSEWFPPNDPAASTIAPNSEANAGFGITAIDDQGFGRSFGRFIGGRGSMGTPTSGPTLTAGNPSTITTTWQLPDSTSPRIEVTQVLSYTNGSRQFDAAYTVKNVGTTDLKYRASMAGDMAIRGSDRGIGFLSTAGARYVGGVNQEVGAAGGFVEVTPWSHYEVGQYSEVGNHLTDVSSTGGLKDTLVTEAVDNGAGVEWDDHLTSPLGPGGTATYTVSQRYIDTLGITPQTDHKLTGETATFHVSAGDINGAALKNKTIDYTVFGADNFSGKVTTNDKGDATISYVGGVPGTDFVAAFVDANGNGTRDLNEPQAQAQIEWEGAAPPVIGQTAGVRPVSGKVKIKLPNGTSAGKAKALGLTGAASSFVPLKGAAQVPVGSILDTSKGTVNLLSAASSNPAITKFQSGNFNGGQFRFTQGRKNPLTQLSMSGGGLKSCKSRVPKGGSAARKHRRKLFGNAHGRFRTRGRNSSATVRGTKWSMTDTCSGTLTIVTRGSVTVRDFSLKKTKTVKAGHRYFAKAPKAKRKRHVK